MRTLLLALALAITFPGAARAQQFEYGKPAELRGLKKVFVDTGPDIKNRERILSELEKAKLDLVLLDSAEGAEIILTFKGGKEKELGGISGSADGTDWTPTYRKITVGQGVVFVVRDGRSRAVLSHSDEEKTVFEKKPATNFAKTFVKAYKKANDTK